MNIALHVPAWLGAASIGFFVGLVVGTVATALLIRRAISEALGNI